MFLLLKYQKLLPLLVKNQKKKLSRFSQCFHMESPTNQPANYTIIKPLQILVWPLKMKFIFKYLVPTSWELLWKLWRGELQSPLHMKFSSPQGGEENFLFKVLLSTKKKVGMAQNSDSFVQNTAACVWNKDKFVSNDNIQYLIRGFSSDRPSVRNAQGTLPGFWNGLDWRALVKY